MHRICYAKKHYLLDGSYILKTSMLPTIRYDTIEEINVDPKAEYTA